MEVTLEELLEAGAHFGHHVRRWNPKMKVFIYGAKDGVHVFDLVKTRDYLIAALGEIQKAKKEGKLILLVGTKKQAKDRIKEIGENTETPYVNERWLGGSLTNFRQIALSVSKLADLKKKLEGGEFAEYTKKEKLLVSRQIEKLEKIVGGLANLNKLPDLMIVIDTHREKGAVIEANRMDIPVVGVIDTNGDPDQVTFPIPMNDDAKAALDFVLALIEKALMGGKLAKN